MANTAASDRSVLRDSGIDGLAIKPTEVDVAALADGNLTDRDLTDGDLDDGAEARPDTVDEPLPDTLVVDFEGAAAVPDADALDRLAARVETLRVTTPVRADGFDPLAEDESATSREIPDAAERVFVAGHPAYLDEREVRRAVAPRLRAAVEEAEERAGEPWVGTEGIERLALAVGGTQFELLTPTVARDVRALRAAGFDGDVAVYAPTVLAEREDAILDAVGEYVARRAAVGEALPAGAATDSSATGDARRVLSSAAREYALVGDVETVRERTDALREAGVDHVVAYPAAGFASLFH